MEILKGRDFTCNALAGEKRDFIVRGTSTHFVSTVLNEYFSGEIYTVETEHSWYQFKLNSNEEIVMGNCVVKDFDRTVRNSLFDFIRR